jgi:DNA-binding beta-propeller fold protein YncE
VPLSAVFFKAKHLRPSLTQVISGGGQCFAVTSLDDKLFVARSPAATDLVLVYDTNTFQLLGNITVPGATGNFYGLAACPVNNCLYVSEMTKHVVYKVELSSAIFDNPKITNKSVCSYPAGLFVNSQHNVMVTCASGRVQEYTTNGSLIRELSDSAIWHSVEVNNGTWAVSRYASKNQVCQLTTSGTVVKCYGNVTAGSALGQMNWPQTMAIDKQGYIVVADENNNRILVLNPTLSDGRLLPLPINDTGTIVQPLGLWLDESRGRLYVAENNGERRLLIFDNVFNLYEAFNP